MFVLFVKINNYCVNNAKIRVFYDPFFPYKDRIVDSVLIRENTDRRKPILCHILQTDWPRVALVRVPLLQTTQKTQH